jgi:hypothetical protein
VIVGIHAGVIAHGIAIPAFPHGGRAVFDEVAPRRVFGAEKQAVGHVGVSGIGERTQQVRSTQKSGTQAPMIGFQAIHQPFRGEAAQRFGQQIHVQCEHVTGLRLDRGSAQRGVYTGRKYRPLAARRQRSRRDERKRD